MLYSILTVYISSTTTVILLATLTADGKSSESHRPLVK
uniref:Uncharacterized protein n=1 Tax=Rhizophora mucronata TaxID=61149 RepID=A0A2P2P446_RHIMU